MRIAFIVDQFPSLTITFILNQLTGLIDDRQEVDIFAESKGESSKIHSEVNKYNLISRAYYRPYLPDNKVYRFIKAIFLIITNLHKNPQAIIKSLNFLKYKKKALSLRLFYNIIPFLDKDSYDIIHCHFGPNGNLGILLKELGILKGKLITSFYGYDISKYIKVYGINTYLQLFKRGDLFIVLSEHMKNRLIKIGCPKELIVKHPLGVDIEKFNFKEGFTKNDNKIRLLTVARLCEKKGIEYSIKAFAKVLNYHKNLSVEYNIVGEGYLRDNLEKLISELQINGKVNLLGSKNHKDIKSIYKNSDIFILTSVTAQNGDEEGTPTVILEAMSTGLPILSTYHSGIPEQVQNGKSGFLVPERDIDALAERLEFLINNPKIWLKMGNIGRKYIEDYYDIKKLNERLIKIYKNLLNG